MKDSSERPFHVGIGELTGAVGDWGILIPLSAALILVNGLDAGAVLLCAGVLILATGVYFRIPFPVQPLKALTAIAVAQRLAPDVIHAAGIELGVILLILSIHGVADLLARLFTKLVVRSLQLGVGILLVIGSIKLVADPPDVFRAVPPSPWPLLLAAGTFLAVAWAVRTRRYWIALVVLIGGVIATAITAHPVLLGPHLSIPTFSFPAASAFATAFFLLAVPQFPLTFGNAVVAVNDLSHEYFGEAARRVSIGRVSRSDGLANLVSGVLGGMPMCHGAGGLTAHVKLGARTAGMNLVLGGTLIGFGAFFARDIPALVGLLPVWVLAAFLAYAGVRHAWLVADLRGIELVIATIAATLGAFLGNLAVTAAIALIAAQTVARSARLRPRAGTLLE